MARVVLKAERIRWLAAELLIVVLGVMAALAVDEWREGRSERSRERMYLARLLAEVRADSANLALIELGLDPKDKALAAVQRWVSGERLVEADSVRINLGASFGWAVPSQPPAAYTEMGLSGALMLIRNEQLRAEIVSYYQTWDHLLFRVMERRSAYPSLLSQAIPPSARGIHARDAAPFLAQLPRQELSRSLNHEMNYSRFLRDEFLPEMKTRTQSLIAAIEDELGQS